MSFTFSRTLLPLSSPVAAEADEEGGEVVVVVVVGGTRAGGGVRRDKTAMRWRIKTRREKEGERDGWL